MAKKKEEDFLDKIVRALTAVNDMRKPHKLATAGVVTALVGGLIKATAFTQTFPAPWDVFGNVILFLALILLVIDFIKGGIMD